MFMVLNTIGPKNAIQTSACSDAERSDLGRRTIGRTAERKILAAIYHCEIILTGDRLRVGPGCGWTVIPPPSRQYRRNNKEQEWRS